MGSQPEMNAYTGINNSNSANFGIESLKFNNHYYNLDQMNGGAAGSRHYLDPYGQNQHGGSGSKSHMHGRHDANPNALKNLNFIKKYQSVGQSINKPPPMEEEAAHHPHNHQVDRSMRLEENPAQIDRDFDHHDLANQHQPDSKNMQ